MVIGSEIVGLGVELQLVFVPYTSRFPEVAFVAKETVMLASDGFIWVMVAPSDPDVPFPRAI